MLVKPDYDTVLKSLRWSCSQNQVTEVRCLTVYRGQATVGYFNDPILAANAIVNGDNDGIAGTYVTLNPVTPEALARCTNHMVSARGNSGMFTQDKEIVERKELYLDFDPKRIAGISSTDAEHEAALAFMVQVTEALTWLYGWPVPCLIDSGNGGHARYMLETLPNDQASTDLVRAVLKTVAAKFNTDQVSIDTSVFNASRIIRVPGTPARKGEDTPDRPHRVSRILREYDPFDLLRTSCLKRLVDVHGVPLPTALEHAKRRRYEYPPDEQNYRKLNNTAKDRYHDWAPHLLGDLVRPSGSGYRIDSDKLGRDLEEAILIDHMGIKDFGVADMGDATEGRRTPISLLVELGIYPDKRQAAAQLAITLNTAMNDMGELALTPKQEPLPVCDDPAVMPSALMGSPIGYASPLSYRDINILELNRLTWMIEDFVINSHYTLITAPTKVGKSTLCRMMVASILTGLPFLGRSVPQGEVLYIAYEDQLGDLWLEVRRNIDMLIQEDGLDPYSGEGFKLREASLDRFRVYAERDGEIGFFNRVPRGKPGLDFLREEVKKYPELLVVMVDPIRFLRDETIRSRNIVDQEYYEGLDFKGFARETGISVVGLHHNNKEGGKKVSEGNDPVTSAGGTAAIGGAPGNIIVFMGDRVPEGVEGHMGLYRLGRIGSPKIIKVQPKNGRFYPSPPDAEIFYQRKMNPVGTGGRGRPTDGPSGKAVDALVATYLTDNTLATIPMIADAINVPKYTVVSRLEVMMHEGIVDRIEDTEGLFKVGPGPKPFLYTLKQQARLPD